MTMKLKVLFCSLLTVLFLQTALAVNPTPATAIVDSEATVLIDADQNKGFFGKIKTKIKTKIAKVKAFVASALDIDLQEPIFKWLWYALIGLAVAVVFSIFAVFVPVLWIVGSLAGLASTICWVVFLIKWIPTL